MPQSRPASRVTGVEATAAGLRVSFDGKGAGEPQLYDRVLCAVGRVPNGKTDPCEGGGRSRSTSAATCRSTVSSAQTCRTSLRSATSSGSRCLPTRRRMKGKVAAEVAAGHKRAFDARVIPSVAYTDPEIAWVGVTETEAQASGQKLGKGLLPVDGERPFARAQSRRGIHEAAVRPGDTIASSAAESSAAMRATSFRKSRSRSRWARWPPTSA